MRADNQKLLTWLNYYGLMRKSQVKVGDAAHVARLDDPEVVEFLQAHVNAALSAKAIETAENEAALATAKMVMSVIPFAAILNTVLDVVLSVITPFFKINKQFGCDERKCKGNVDFDRRHYIGIYPPPGRRWPQQGAGGSNGAGRPIQRDFHDGLVLPLKPKCRPIPSSGKFVVTGQDQKEGRWNTLICPRSLSVRYLGNVGTSRLGGQYYTKRYEVVPQDKLYPGQGFGVFATRYTWVPAVRKFRKRGSFPSYLKGVISEGSKSNPATSSHGSFWYRQWAATRLLRWLQDAVPCRNLICLSSLLHVMSASRKTLDDPETGRKMGGAWFASVYYMHKDFNTLAKRLGAVRVVAAIKASGARNVKMDRGLRLEDKPYGWSWWLVSKQLSMIQLTKALTKLAPQDPRGGVADDEITYKAPNPFALARVQIQRRVAEFKWTNAHSAGAAAVGGLGLLALYTYFRKR